MRPNPVDTSSVTSFPSPPTSPDSPVSSQHKRKRSTDGENGPERKQAKLDPMLLKQYLANGGTPNIRDEQRGYSLLCWACKSYSESCLKLLLHQNDIDINAVHGPERSTALHAAVAAGYHRGIELLSQHPKIDLNATDALGQSPLHWAVLTNQPQCLNLLLQKGTGVDIQDENGRHALQVAVFHRRLECVSVLLRYSAALDLLWTRSRADGRSTVEDAVVGGYSPILQLLIREAGSSLSPEKRLKLIQLAIVWNRLDCLKILVTSGKDVDQPLTKDDPTDTPLYRAVQQRKIDIVRFLRSVGATPCLSNGQNPSFLYAVNHGFLEMLPLLLTPSTSTDCLRQALVLAETLGLRHQVLSIVRASRTTLLRN